MMKAIDKGQVYARPHHTTKRSLDIQRTNFVLILPIDESTINVDRVQKLLLGKSTQMGEDNRQHLHGKRTPHLLLGMGTGHA